MPAKAKAQGSFEEAIVDDKELLEVLEKRESMRDAITEYRRLDRAAKARIDEKKYGEDGDVRIGRFVVGQRRTSARHASFDVASGTRIVIRVAEGD